MTSLYELARGVITVGYINSDLLEILYKFDGSVVCLFPGRDVPDFVTIDTADEEGILAVMHYLYDLSHRRVVFVTGHALETLSVQVFVIDVLPV